jgi:YqaJ-like viral recombinase domain
MFTVIDVPQRSEAWFAVRLGRVTGSCAAAMLATIKSGEAAARRDLRTRLVLERLLKRSPELPYQNAEMRWGIEHEHEACAAYEAATGELVTHVGFLAHPNLLAGCSPDGIIGDYEGLLEVKCPKSTTHLQYLRATTVPPEYVPQLQHNLWITGAQWADLVSYDPRFPKPLRLFVRRWTLSEVQRRAYELAVRLFLKEVETEYTEVATLLAGVAA